MKETVAIQTGRTRRAFTLIELLVVIAVIAILASLIFPVTSAVNRQKIRSKARAEVEQVEMAIQGYKDKLGYYPPGNANNYALTTLYYELMGTTRQGSSPNFTYQTLDKNSTVSAAQLQAAFGTSALMNSMVAGGSEEGLIAQRFLLGSRPWPTAPVDVGQNPAVSPQILVTSVGWRSETIIFPSNPKVSPIFYNPINPTNNPNSFDLWVDVIVNDKTNRISNWSKEALIP